jgi:hypothetical protein
VAVHSVADSADQRDPLEEVAERFLDRWRRGERPVLEEFLAHHPDRAEELRELLSSLSDRERAILAMRHGGDEGEEATLAEIGQRLGTEIGAMRVAEIEKQPARRQIAGGDRHARGPQRPDAPAPGLRARPVAGGGHARPAPRAPGCDRRLARPLDAR